MTKTKRAKLLETPVFLLLATGGLIGLNFPLGKIAGEAGVSPLLWAWLISFAAAVSLLPFLFFGKNLAKPGRAVLRYSFISGMVSFVAANLLLFSAIPHVGAGYAGLMFALSPVFTLAIAILFKLKAPGAIGIIGISIGFLGAILVAFSRQSGADAPSLFWLLSALLIPITLAIGNVYRTLAWPQGQSPDLLAFWAHLFSAIVLALLLVIFFGPTVFFELSQVPLIALIQAIVAGMTFPLFFRLQQFGGPVLLSQIGYVAAAVGLVAATLFLSEVYGMLTWVGAGVIALGIGFTVFSQRPKK